MYSAVQKRNNMNMNMKITIFFAFCLVLIKAFPQSNSERSALIREQAQEDYKHHQDVLRNQNYGPAPKYSGGLNQDGSLSLTFDNKDKNYRDRGYGYEKAYAYTRETAFFDFLDDKPSLDARAIVENYGNSEEKKNEDLFDEVAN